MDQYDQSKSRDNLPLMYPKFAIMYEYFRLLRGEAFVDVREHGNPEYQKEYYTMEHDLECRMDKFKSQLDQDDPRLKYYIELLQTPYLKIS